MTKQKELPRQRRELFHPCQHEICGNCGNIGHPYCAGRVEAEDEILVCSCYCHEMNARPQPAEDEREPRLEDLAIQAAAFLETIEIPQAKHIAFALRSRVKSSQPAASTPTEAVCPECQGRAGLDFHDEGCGFDRSGKGETAVVLAHCTWKPTLIRCVKCSHRGDSRRVVYCPTCGCKCEFEPAASTEAKCKRCNGTGEVEGYGGNLIYCGSCAGTGKTFESLLTDFAASTEGQDERCVACAASKAQMAISLEHTYGTGCSLAPTAPASYAEPHKQIQPSSGPERLDGSERPMMPKYTMPYADRVEQIIRISVGDEYLNSLLIKRLAEFASTVATETRVRAFRDAVDIVSQSLDAHDAIAKLKEQIPDGN